MTEIITGAERAAATTGEPLMTLSQLTGLLNAAAALEQARRPIVLHATTEVAPAVTVLPTDPGHLPPVAAAGVMVAPMFAAPAAPLRHGVHVNRWGVKFAYASIAAALAGAADGVVSGTAPLSVSLVALGILGAVAGTARALGENDRENGS